MFADGAQRFQTRQFPGQFFIRLATRVINQRSGGLFSICLAQLQMAWTSCCTALTSLPSVAIHGAELTVEGFKLDLGGQIVAVFI